MKELDREEEKNKKLINLNNGLWKPKKEKNSKN